MKRSDLLHEVLGRLHETAAREALAVEPRGAECAGPGEYVVTVYGTPAHVSRFAEALSRDDKLHSAQVVEDLGETNLRLHGAADAGRARHLHVALSVPSLW
jgi:hypothetical protein